MTRLRNVILLNCIVLAVVAVAVGADPTCPALPCLLNNGCVCNRSSPTTVVGGQTFASCQSCNTGWTGPTCETRFDQCANGGAIDRTTGVCACALGWTGADCEQIVCVNSINGTGVDRTAWPSSITNVCENCAEGFAGTQCQLCTTNDACGTGNGCDKSLLPFAGLQKNLECDVTTEPILRLLGSGRPVGGKANIRCDFDSASNAGTHPQPPTLRGTNVTRPGQATCQIQFFRVEPNHSWTDAFFFCQLDNCTATSTVTGGIDPTKSSVPGSDSLTRSAAELVILVCCFVLALNHALFPVPTRTKMRIVIWSLRILVATVVVMLIVFGLSLDPSRWDVIAGIMHWNASSTGAVATVTYTCPSSRCRCAPDPPNAAFSPFCHGSLFGSRILPILTHGALIACNSESGACTFSQNDLNSPIGLQCRSGDCVTAANASVVRDLTPDHQVTAHEAGENAHSTATGVAWLAFVFVVCAALLHYLRAYTTRSALALKFEEAFIKPTDGEHPPEVARHRVLGEAAEDRADERLANRHDEVAQLSTAAPPRSGRDAVLSRTRASPDSSAQYYSGQEQDHTRAHEAHVTTATNVRSVMDLDATPNTTPGPTAGDADPPPQPQSPPMSRRTRSTDPPAAFASSPAFRYNEFGTVPHTAPINPLNAAVAHLNAPWDLVIKDLRYTVVAAPATGGARPTVPAAPRGNDDDGTTLVPVDSTTSQQRRRAAVRKLLQPRSRTSKKVVIDGVSLSIKAGECVAIMGASGAGKTTLLDLLACRDKVGTVSGTVSVAGEPLLSVSASAPVTAKAPSPLLTSLGVARDWCIATACCRRGTVLRGPGPTVDAAGYLVRSPAAAEAARAWRMQRYRSIVGYAAQEDTLLPTLTVRQTLRCAAVLKLPAALSAEAIEDIVDQAIDALGLRRCADSLVGSTNGAGSVRGLSGGERRRVSIAAELVGCPKILFLDEPTSGLDSVSALRVMQCVSTIARRGSSAPQPDVDEEDALAETESNASFTSSGESRGPTVKPFSAGALVPLLGRWAVVNPIVVFSIHQPSREIYNLFGKLILLHKGQIVYHGPAAEAVARFRATLDPVLAAPPPITSASASGLTMRGDSTSRSADSIDLPSQDAALSIRDMRRRQARRTFVMTNDAASTSPADFLMHVVASCSGAEVEALTLVASAAGAAASDIASNPIDPMDDSSWGPMSDAAEFRERFRLDAWRQLSLLVHRGLMGVVGGYHIVVAHAMVVLFLSVMLTALYHAEPLDLSGTLNRAGSFTFLELILALSSLSCLEAALAEKKLLALEREASVVSGLPVFMTRVIIDVLPLRVLPAVLIGCVTYAPMGMRVDHGSYFLWYLLIVALFTTTSSLITYAVGLVCPGLGTAVLVSAIVILWNFVFGGLLIQVTTIPALLRPFRYASPFFLAYEAVLDNELGGQTCTFAPTDASGRPADTSIPLYCTQYLFNMGLDPHAFAGDASMLVLWAMVWSVVVCLLLHNLRFER